MSIESLFTAVRMGTIELPHRIVMAPLTRMRADDFGVPGLASVEYYAQRSSAALIITEATAISVQGREQWHQDRRHKNS